MSRILGIDPGQRTGLAWFVDGRISNLETVPPHHVERILRGVKPPAVVFEDSRLQPHTWTRGVSLAASSKMARNVGQIDAWCILVQEVCHELSIACLGISPRDKGPKLDAQAFAQVTGWEGKSNQHERDAAMVAWRYRNGFGGS